MLQKITFFLLLSLFIVLNISAQPYPTRPVTIVVPQAPGGTNDSVARILSQKLSEQMGQPFIVENKPGAGGNIGTQYVAAAPKDGYTILLTISSTQAINPWLYKSPGFDPVKDFQPIALVGVVPNVLVVNPSFPAKNLAEFIAMAKKNDPPYHYASAGNGSLNHLLGEMINESVGGNLEHVPYKGVAPALNDLLGGQIPIAFASLPSCIQYIQTGKLRALGVSSAKRSPFLPNVPAISEAIPKFSGDLWIAFFAANGVPKNVIDKLSSQIQIATSSQEVIEKYNTLGIQRLNGGPDKLAALLNADLMSWKKIVQKSGASVD
ncbi:Bug family tripartite tricarboxylate transporter substrate binding protein [Polynucleobacter sinensis]|uniref:Bug family tripartite tricarboxylate transporter substrate binding protein n=1 Tax=Polynucleobacter sinensis TaxID=1743157 RepID=UPI0007823A9A|nr:tripartite tricarboxylate transporter substrate binding protein [Polynucleobacter sinensis]